MTQYTVYDSSGSAFQSVVDISFNETFANQADRATIELYDEAEVDSIENNEEITIERDSDTTTVFRGRCIEIPTGNKDSYEINLKQKYTDLLDMECDGRIFYYEDSGTVIKKLITERLESRGTELVSDCSSLTNVTSDVPVFDLGEFRALPVEKYGTDLIFAGFPKSNTPNTNYQMTFSNLTFSGEKFYSMQIRSILNNLSGIFSLTVNYVDTNGKNYVWDLGSPDGVQNFVLEAEEATNTQISGGLDPSTDKGKLRILIELNGKPVESRAIGIDGILMTSVDVKSRSHDFASVNIPTSDRKIKRKFTNTVSEAIYNILQEENKKLVVDENNDVTVKERGATSTDLNINSSTQMVDFSVNTDTDNIRNKIIVQGADNIIVERNSTSSQNYFGFTKTLKVRDRSIITKSDAIDKAKSLLNKYAWRDTRITIKIPNTNLVKNTSVGDQITINYKEISGEFVVVEKNIRSNSFVELVIEAESANM